MAKLTIRQRQIIKESEDENYVWEKGMQKYVEDLKKRANPNAKQKAKKRQEIKTKKRRVKYMEDRIQKKEELLMKKMVDIPLTSEEEEWLNKIKVPTRKNITMEEATWTVGGPSPNPNGRPKGSKNKWSKVARLKLQEAFSWSLSSLEDDLKSMTASERVKALSQLGKFILAEKKSVQKKVKIQNRIEVSFSDEFSDTIELQQKKQDAIEFEDINDEDED